MTDLADWLLSQIAEDEAAARAATPGPWRWTGDYPEGTCPHGEWADHGPFWESASTTETYTGSDEAYPASVIRPWGYDASGMDIKDADAAHIARHDPARVLAEVAAKRELIRQAEMLAEYVDATREHDAYRYEPTLRRLLIPLAQPYADRPDFDSAWKVEP